MSEWRSLVKEFHGDMRAASAVYRGNAGKAPLGPGRWHYDWLIAQLDELGNECTSILVKSKKKSQANQSVAVRKENGTYCIEKANGKSVSKKYTSKDQALDIIDKACKSLRFETHHIKLSCTK